MKSKLDLAERIFLWPLFGGITTIIGVIGAYLASHFDKEVATATLPVFWKGAVFSPEATLVWITVSIFGTFFTGTFWAQARSAARANNDLQDATKLVGDKTESLTEKTDALNDLVKQLHTLPPKGFLEEYRDAIYLANEAFFSVGQDLPQPTADEVAAAIRAQLICILKLASTYDVDGKKARYGCNLMIFRDSVSMLDKDVQMIDSRMKFVDDGVTVRKLAGALDLLLPLSVATDSGTNPDSKLDSFALPVPSLPNDTSRDDNYKLLLPGAPLAFVDKTETAIESPDDWLKRAEPFSAKVKQDLEEYFRYKQEVLKSFASIPLYRPTAIDGENPIGVLNIHRNLPNKLLAEKLELFAPLLVPITFLMGRLLSTYGQKSSILK